MFEERKKCCEDIRNKITPHGILINEKLLSNKGRRKERKKKMKMMKKEERPE